MGGWVVGVRGKGSRLPGRTGRPTIIHTTVFTCLRATSGTSFRNLGSGIHRLLLFTVHLSLSLLREDLVQRDPRSSDIVSCRLMLRIVRTYVRRLGVLVL